MKKFTKINESNDDILNHIMSSDLDGLSIDETIKYLTDYEKYFKDKGYKDLKIMVDDIYTYEDPEGRREIILYGRK